MPRRSSTGRDKGSDPCRRPAFGRVPKTRSRTEQMDFNPSARNARRRIVVNIRIASHYGFSGGEHFGSRHARRVERSLEFVEDPRTCRMQRVRIEPPVSLHKVKMA